MSAPSHRRPSHHRPSHRRPPHRWPPYRHAGRRRVLLGSLMVVLAMAPILPATTAAAAPPPGTPALHQSAELVSQPLGTDSHQGQDVALSADGSTLAVASVTWNLPSAVVVYVRSGDRWLTETTLRSPPTPAGQDNQWADAIAISADGDTLAVGDPRATVLVGGTSLGVAGVVDLFTRSGQTWRAAGRLVEPQPRFAGWFGKDVSLSGDGTRVAVGSSGHAFIADAGSRLVQELPAPAGATSFGSSVAISPDGETVVVGARGGGAHSPRPGGAFVLVDDPVSGWIQLWHLKAQPGQEGSGFGAAVAVTDTDTVVVGGNYSHRAVSVYDRRGAALVRTARFTPQYDRQAYGLGASVAVSADGTTVVAGAPTRTAGGSIINAGAGYRWVRSPGGWSWAGLLSVAHPNAYEYQGWSSTVSSNGRVVVLGAPERTSARRGHTGAAIVFSAVP